MIYLNKAIAFFSGVLCGAVIMLLVYSILGIDTAIIRFCIAVDIIGLIIMCMIGYKLDR